MKGYLAINQRLSELNFARKSRLDIEDMRTVFQALQLKDYPKVHIAGTNGKGSCVKKISSAFKLSGYKAGSFTSPHIASFRERIQINDQMISESDLATYAQEIFQLSESMQIELTFFEIITLIALKYFTDQQVDIAIIEVGLGGRLDATNCITPILSIITSISLDHTDLLGDTLEKIAFEKAGIIKPFVPVLIGPHSNQQSIKQRARELKAPLIEVKCEKGVSYDVENQVIAQRALAFLQDKFKLSDPAIKEALTKKPFARFEKVKCFDHDAILDISHNEDGLTRLFQQIKNEYVGKEIVVFTSMSCNHNYVKNLEIIDQNADAVFILDVEHVRLATASILKSHVEKAAICTMGQVPEFVQNLSKEALIVFTGSIFIMSRIYKMLQIAFEEDEFSIQDGVFKKKHS